MKNLLLLLLFAVILPWLPLNVEAQIGENDTSAEYIAIQCAISSGNLASDYLEYGHKLAKTISLLDLAQQERIFGSIPQPAATTSGATSGASAESISGASAGLISGTSAGASSSGDSATGTASGATTIPVGGESSAPTTNPLIEAVGALNDMLTGDGSSAVPIIGGTAPVEEPAAATGPSQAFLDEFNAWVAGLSQAVVNSTKKFKEAFKAQFDENYEDIFHEPYKDVSKAIDKKAGKILDKATKK
ncbi:MAG: hypothetical protein P1U86_17240 [Verrucomicrobiales bacterium]|nr:hypothetical protein [Verrucomicrobiales bacterium]